MKIRLSQLRRLIRETVRQQLLIESTLTDNDMLKVKEVLVSMNPGLRDGWPLDPEWLEGKLTEKFDGDESKVAEIMGMFDDPDGGGLYVDVRTKLGKYLKATDPEGKYYFYVYDEDGEKKDTSQASQEDKNFDEWIKNLGIPLTAEKKAYYRTIYDRTRKENAASTAASDHRAYMP